MAAKLIVRHRPMTDAPAFPEGAASQPGGASAWVLPRFRARMRAFLLAALLALAAPRSAAATVRLPLPGAARRARTQCPVALRPPFWRSQGLEALR
jgi:hypothetical protein